VKIKATLSRWVVLVRLYLAHLCAPKSYDVYSEIEVRLQENLAAEIARRILSSGHFSAPNHPVRYKAAKDIGRLAQLLYRHTEILKGIPERAIPKRAPRGERKLTAFLKRTLRQAPVAR
jgi:hypothetical protein